MLPLLRTTAVALLAVAAVSACSDDSDSLGPVERAARVRVVHASPDAPNVDVLVDNTVALTDVSYRTASTFLRVDPGSRRLRVRATAAPTVVPIDATVPLENRGNYTVLATGLLAGIQPLVTADTIIAPAPGNVRLRVIHAAPAAGNVDVYATAVGADINTATPVLTNVPFRGVSSYLEVPEGTYELRVTPAGTKTVAISAVVTLGLGQVRTVVATDAPGGGAPLGAIVLNDLN